jgi:hypothetical protein
MKPDLNFNDLPRKLPYSVPDRYFDELPSRIQNRIQGKARLDGEYSWFPGVSFPRLRVALASLVLVVTGSLMVVLNQPVPEAYASLENIQQGEVIRYLALNEMNPDVEELAEISTIDNSLAPALPTVQAEDLTDLVEEDEIENYLL